MKLRKQFPLHLMIWPGMVLIFMFAYVPMFGNLIAFQHYTPLSGMKHSPWIGWDNFKYVFSLPDTRGVIWNTIYISAMKIVSSLIIAIIVALLLNEVMHKWVLKSVQTAIYLPHFMSWIILGGIMIDLLSFQGLVNSFIGFFGIKPIYFLGDNHWFPYVLVASDTWKDLGFNTIIYLAAITSIDTSLYEAAIVDGAGKWRQAWHVTLPGISAVVILVGALSLGSILNAGFEQVFTLYSPQVYPSGDILDTLVYRMGLIDAQYGPATAIGLFKSFISFIMVFLSYFLARKYANYRIF